MTKTKIKETAKIILHKYKVGEWIDDESDYYFLLNLFSNHPDWDIKKGSGIIGITTRVTKYGNKCFSILRSDGSETDISYIHSISPYSKRSDIKAACRTAIIPEINKVRLRINYGVDRCEFTGEILTPGNTHIDHYDLTFNDLFNNWMVDKDTEEIHKLLNDGTKDGVVSIEFIDDYIKKDFITYHNANTHLRAVSKKANLSLLK